MNDFGTLQLPPQASTVAPRIDALYYFIFWGCTVFFVIVVGLAAWFAIRYRRREGEAYRPSATHNTPLEITWTVIPLILVMVVFFWGFDTYMDLHIAPRNSLVYHVTAKQWLWQITDPAGEVTVNEMTVPVGQPVKLILQSAEVIHSFYVPDFRVKMDVYPNQYTTMWFEATRTGDFDLFCAEYCGAGHSGMIGKIHVLEQADFERWRESISGPKEGEPLADYGRKMYEKKACITCHSLDGSTRTGPSFLGAFGRTEQFADGTSGTVDENYIRQSILEPQAKIVAGYQPVMPTYTGLLKPVELDALVEFLKTVK